MKGREGKQGEKVIPSEPTLQEEIVEGECIWHKLLHDSQSTSGMDMRKRPTLMCHLCNGTNACALKNKCHYYLDLTKKKK